MTIGTRTGRQVEVDLTVEITGEVKMMVTDVEMVVENALVRRAAETNPN